MVAGEWAGRRRAFLSTSFVRKVVGLSLVSTVSALFVAFAIFQWLDWRGDERDLAQDAAKLGGHMAEALTQADGVRAAQAMFRADEDTSWAAYYPDGGSVVRFTRADAPTAFGEPRGVSELSFDFRPSGPEARLPVTAGGRRVGELVVGADSTEIREALQRNVLIALVCALGTTLMAGFVSAVLALRTLAPLHALNRAIETVRSTKDFSSPVQVTSEDEIGRLTENFNALLADLEVYSTHLQQALSEVMAARDAAEDATRMKSQFLANMSHEIRTPLNGVLGMAQIMATAPLSPDQAERLEVIRRSGAALLAVLNDVLDLSKIEAGRLDIEWEPFSIDEVAHGAYSVFTTAANAKGLSFGLNIEDSAKGMWRGDSVRVRQLLYNQLSNAIKFTEEGEVRVTIARERNGDADVFVMTCADTGVGVAPDALPRLFEKFTQADVSTTRKFGGTGLGLTICRHIAELMGGTIEAASELGRGTTFVVRLPLDYLGTAAASPAPEAGPEDAGPDLTRLRVLAAEDNETNQLVLKTILHSLGVTPVVVADGRQAVEAWANGEFYLVLMDIQMPILDGIAATQEIRTREFAAQRPHTRIVALSANAMRHQVGAYLAAGMDGHLAKPISIERLHACLTEAAGGAASVDCAA